jgi:hypothetical protein
MRAFLIPGGPCIVLALGIATADDTLLYSEPLASALSRVSPNARDSILKLLQHEGHAPQPSVLLATSACTAAIIVRGGHPPASNLEPVLRFLLDINPSHACVVYSHFAGVGAELSSSTKPMLESLRAAWPRRFSFVIPPLPTCNHTDAHMRPHGAFLGDVSTPFAPPGAFHRNWNKLAVTNALTHLEATYGVGVVKWALAIRADLPPRLPAILDVLQAMVERAPISDARGASPQRFRLVTSARTTFAQFTGFAHVDDHMIFGHVDDLRLYYGPNPFWHHCDKVSATQRSWSDIPPTPYGTYSKEMLTTESEFGSLFIALLGAQGKPYSSFRALLTERFLPVRHGRLGMDVWIHHADLSRVGAGAPLDSLCNRPGTWSHATDRGVMCIDYETWPDTFGEGGALAEACALSAFTFDCTRDPSHRYTGVRDRREGNGFFCEGRHSWDCTWGKILARYEKFSRGDPPLYVGE